MGLPEVGERWKPNAMGGVNKPRPIHQAIYRSKSSRDNDVKVRGSNDLRIIN